MLGRRACGNDRQRRDERAAVVARAVVTRVRDAHARDGFQRVGELEVNLAEARELLVDDAVIRLRVDEPAGAGNEANEISRGRELRVELRIDDEFGRVLVEVRAKDARGPGEARTRIGRFEADLLVEVILRVGKVGRALVAGRGQVRARRIADSQKGRQIVVGGAVILRVIRDRVLIT